MTFTTTNFRSTLVRTGLRAVVAAVLLALVSLVVAPTSGAVAADSTDVTWSVRTASNTFGAERTSYRYTINPGSTVKDALVVANRGTAQLDLRVYAADGYTTDSGDFDLLVAGKKSTNVGAWLHGDTATISVPAGGTVEVPFTVDVPKNATPGDYAGGIVTSLAETQKVDGINVDRRLGIRVGLRVGGDITPALSVRDVAVGWGGGLNPFAGGDASVSYTLENTGNEALAARQTASVAGPFGALARNDLTIKDSPVLLPGEKWKVTVPVNDVIGLLLLTATTTVTPIVTDASGSTTPLDPIATTVVGLAVPWMLVLILVLIAAAIIVTIQVRKRTRRTRTQREDARVQEAVERALAEAGAEKP